MEQFEEYLFYKPFTVRTDNNPLTYIMTTPNLDACGHRWVASLSRFNFKIEYLKGTDNKVADVLSRVENRLDDTSVKELLMPCPTTEIKGTSETQTPSISTLAFEDLLPNPEDGRPRTKVQKEAVNELITRANSCPPRDANCNRNDRRLNGNRFRTKDIAPDVESGALSCMISTKLSGILIDPMVQSSNLSGVTSRSVLNVVLARRYLIT